MLVLVAGAGLGTVGGMASAVAAPSGSDGDVVLGTDAQSTSLNTGITTSGVIGFHAVSTYQSGYGLFGEGNYGVQGNGTTVGVYGYNTNAGAAVYGDNQGNGWGVYGSSASGIGVTATSSGTALQVIGRASFSLSGVATIAKGKSTVTVSAALASSSFVLATLQAFQPGFSVAAAVPNVGKGTFTIHLNKTATSKMKVAWFVVN
jgi:hypothetical protein